MLLRADLHCKSSTIATNPTLTAFESFVGSNFSRKIAFPISLAWYFPSFAPFCRSYFQVKWAYSRQSCSSEDFVPCWNPILRSVFPILHAEVVLILLVILANSRTLAKLV